MKVSKGITSKPGVVWKLKKALYGMKQAPKTWYLKLHKLLVAFGFVRTISDNCVYVKKQGEFQLTFSVYVDDFIMVSHNLEKLHELRDYLRKYFRITDLCEAKSILGIQIIRDKSGIIKLSQEQYTKEIMSKYKLQNCKPLSTPLELKCQFSKFIYEPTDNVPYTEAIGSLMYLSVGARPDISADVGILSKFCNAPKRSYWECVKRVFTLERQLM